MPRISIGLPVYNGENYIEEAINSVLEQTFDDFELIISDNCSNDSTVDICRRFASQDKRIKLYLNEENRGAAWNYNYVFSLAKGEYFKWASHDDFIGPTYLEKCKEVLDRYPEVVLCYPQTLIIDASGARKTEYFDDMHLDAKSPILRFEKFMFRKGRKCHPVFGLIRRTTLQKTQLIGSYNASDQVLLAHLSLLGQFYEVPERLFYRRDHPGSSINANKSAKSIAEWFDPRRRKAFILPSLRLAYEYLRCILYSQMSIAEKSLCIKNVLKRTWWGREQVCLEIKNAVRGI